MSYFAVGTINQASRHLDDLEGPFWEFKEAAEVAAILLKENRSHGRREQFLVYKLAELDETGEEVPTW